MTRKRYTKLYLRHHTSTKTRKIRERMWEASSDDSLLFLELQPIFDCVLTCLVSCIINIYKKLPLFIASSLDPFREHSLFWKVITESNDISCLRDLRSKHSKLPGNRTVQLPVAWRSISVMLCKFFNSQFSKFGNYCPYMEKLKTPYANTHLAGNFTIQHGVEAANIKPEKPFWLKQKSTVFCWRQYWRSRRKQWFCGWCYSTSEDAKFCVS